MSWIIIRTFLEEYAKPIILITVIGGIYLLGAHYQKKQDIAATQQETIKEQNALINYNNADNKLKNNIGADYEKTNAAIDAYYANLLRPVLDKGDLPKAIAPAIRPDDTRAKAKLIEWQKAFDTCENKLEHLQQYDRERAQ